MPLLFQSRALLLHQFSMMMCLEGIHSLLHPLPSCQSAFSQHYQLCKSSDSFNTSACTVVPMSWQYVEAQGVQARTVLHESRGDMLLAGDDA